MKSPIMTLGCALALQYLAGTAQAPAAEAHVTATGTGFIVNSDGWIVTNAHVLEGCNFATVHTFDGRVDELRTDKINDLAAFKLDSAAGHSHLTLSSPLPRLGEDIAAFGFPLSSLLSDSVKVTTGNVNSLVGLHNDTRFLQVSTPIQPGNSGGPVVDRRGTVVGVATATLSLEAALKSGALPQNVNFAVKTNILKIFLESNGITYGAGEGQGGELSTVDLADLVAPAVVQVLCNTEGAAPNVAAAQKEQQQSQTETTKIHQMVCEREGGNAGGDYIVVYNVSGMSIDGRSYPVTERHMHDGTGAFVVSGDTKFGTYSAVFAGPNPRVEFWSSKEHIVEQCSKGT